MTKSNAEKPLFGIPRWRTFRWYVLALLTALLGAILYFHWIVVSPRHFMQTIYVSEVSGSRVSIAYPHHVKIDTNVQSDQIIKTGRSGNYKIAVMVFEGEWKGSWLITAWNLVGRGESARIHSFSLYVNISGTVTAGTDLTAHQKLALAVDQGLIRARIRVRPTDRYWASVARGNKNQKVPLVDIFMEGDLISFEPIP